MGLIGLGLGFDGLALWTFKVYKHIPTTNKNRLVNKMIDKHTQNITCKQHHVI